MKTSAIHGQVVPSLLAGTSRRPLPPDHGPLELLSLAGQALRFERPAPPSSFVVEGEIKDERKTLAARLRRPFVRLLAASKATEHPGRALAREFDELRIRPHPFDFPVIERFIRTYAERLGPAAQHWIDRQKPPSEAGNYFDEEVLNDANWADAKLSRRVSYLDARRRADPDAARTLLESVWGQESADARFRLLQVLQSGLTAADQPFLESLETDRAPRVRSLAARYLARLGASSHNPALQVLLERITRKQSGLLRKRTVLQLDVPANLKDQAVSRWVRETFAEVSIPELAHALDLGDEELIDAAAKQEDLLLGLALLATSECRWDLLEKLVTLLPNAWERMFETGMDDLGWMTVQERQRWTETIAKPHGKSLPASYVLWDWLHRVTDSAAPPSLMDAVLETKLLEHVQNFELTGAAWTELLAALCPATQRQALREQIAGFDPSLTVNSLALLDILDGMENDRTNG